jgi:RNA polymerase sigma-70 factor (ECF subfamily)
VYFQKSYISPLPFAQFYDVLDTSLSALIKPEGVVRALTEMEDQELVDLARTDYEAFDVLYRRYAVPIYRYCYARTDNVADAEDLTTQTFMAALEGLQRYRRRNSFSSWLFGVARHKCADFYRAQYADLRTPVGDEIESVVDYSDEADPEAQVDLRDLLDCIQRGLPLITKDRVDALRLRYWGGLSISDISRVTHRSQGAVKMLLSRAISDLRERCVTI